MPDDPIFGETDDYFGVGLAEQWYSAARHWLDIEERKKAEGHSEAAEAARFAAAAAALSWMQAEASDRGAGAQPPTRWEDVQAQLSSGRAAMAAGTPLTKLASIHHRGTPHSSRSKPFRRSARGFPHSRRPTQHLRRIPAGHLSWEPPVTRYTACRRRDHGKPGRRVAGHDLRNTHGMAT
jgi:hypothetical protein